MEKRENKKDRRILSGTENASVTLSRTRSRGHVSQTHKQDETISAS